MHKNLDIQFTFTLAVVLTIVFLFPVQKPFSAPNGTDKFFHFLAFLVLVFPFSLTGRFKLPIVFWGAIAFGGGIELIQPTFNRSGDINDWIADTLGVLFGVSCGILGRNLR